MPVGIWLHRTRPLGLHAHNAVIRTTLQCYRPSSLFTYAGPPPDFPPPLLLGLPPPELLCLPPPCPVSLGLPVAPPFCWLFGSLISLFAGLTFRGLLLSYQTYQHPTSTALSLNTHTPPASRLAVACSSSGLVLSGLKAAFSVAAAEESPPVLLYSRESVLMLSLSIMFCLSLGRSEVVVNVRVGRT